MAKERKNPFRPGAGEAPPHRAGHKDAERVLLRRVGRLVDAEPGGMVVLYGPRGTGKTVLLREIRNQATKRDIRVRALNPSNWGNSTETFIRHLASGVIDQSRMKGEITLKAICGKLKIVYDPDFVSPVAEEILRLTAKKGKRVALFVDEAHRLPPDIAECLLNAVQECVGGGVPLLLVLAGTPGLRVNLSRAGASFWERATRVRLGRLEFQDDTRAALSLPAESSGLPLAPDALEFLVAESQGYPYFIQLVGEQSWEAAIERDPNADRIRLEDAQAGVRAANRQREELYADRVREINNRKILSEAQAVSKAFHAIGGDGVLPEAELGAELEPVLTGDRNVQDAIDELFAVGLIWQTDDSAFWEPGIPSLCTHIAKRAMTKTR